jgi:hypothetical protein
MPRLGSLDLATWARTAPVISGYKTEPWTLKGAETVEVRNEIENLVAVSLLPPALHPSMPAYATFRISRIAESPAGPFGWCEVRVVGRAVGIPVGFVLRCFCDNDAAARELTSRWGYPIEHGEINISTLHYRGSAAVTSKGRTVFKVEMFNRESSLSLLPLPAVNLARNKLGEKLVLVQVDNEARVSRSERAAYRIVALDQNALAAGGTIRPANPMSATLSTADLILPRIQYIYDPARPAEEGRTVLD